MCDIDSSYNGGDNDSFERYTSLPAATRSAVPPLEEILGDLKALPLAVDPKNLPIVVNSPSMSSPTSSLWKLSTQPSTIHLPVELDNHPIRRNTTLREIKELMDQLLLCSNRTNLHQLIPLARREPTNSFQKIRFLSGRKWWNSTNK
ncbi:UNVERIFIED_CONTAM: hypothetical protein Sangu_0483300 [Sesamum angustifolium]|uniref:Uncharacterized protein n=1 Tax=Sesamum angustifolium TaxID=2727405 RepID=A0AAW2Q7T5_9LAMI